MRNFDPPRIVASAALERLVIKGLADRAALEMRKEAWADAYRHTPHGKPVELSTAQEIAFPAKERFRWSINNPKGRSWSGGLQHQAGPVIGVDLTRRREGGTAAL